MAQTIKQRDYLFRPRPRRTRPALAIMVLGAMSLVAAASTETIADEPQAAADAAPVELG